MLKKLFIIFCLSFSSGLPLALVSSTLQAWFAEAGMTIGVTGVLSLISIPYLYRFMWSPLLDRFNPFALGKRRGWIFLMQLLLASGLYLMTWFVPQTAACSMGVLAFLLAICAATQDAAIDAHRIEYLPLELYGIGASIAVFAYRVALLVSGGLALIMASHNGWVFTYRVMGAFMIVGMLAVYLSPEPSKPSANSPELVRSFKEPFRALSQQPQILLFCLFVVLYKFGEAFTTSTSGIIMPFLIQGLKFSLETIGYVNKIWGVVAIVVGSVCGGVLLIRFTLYQALFLFGVLQALTNVIFIALAVAHQQLWLLIVAVISDNFVAGMGTTALVALLMRYARGPFTATHFSILSALAGMPRVLSGPIGAVVQSYWGWVGLYGFAFLLAVAFIPLLYHLRCHSIFAGKKYTHNQA